MVMACFHFRLSIQTVAGFQTSRLRDLARQTSDLSADSLLRHGLVEIQNHARDRRPRGELGASSACRAAIRRRPPASPPPAGSARTTSVARVEQLARTPALVSGRLARRREPEGEVEPALVVRAALEQRALAPARARPRRRSDRSSARAPGAACWSARGGRCTSRDRARRRSQARRAAPSASRTCTCPRRYRSLPLLCS